MVVATRHDVSRRVWTLAGAFFFRVRSFAPLLIIFVALDMTWRAHLVESPANIAMNTVGVVLCVLGAAVRFVTIAAIPRGTSLQSRRIQAAALNTTGPYAVVRHPLYLGNFFITFGLLSIANEPWAWVVGLLYVFASQLFIAHAEDEHLRRAFGEVFEAWEKEVPAWRPRLSKLRELRGPFAWKRAIQREVNPLVAWGSGITLLLMWEKFAMSQLTSALGLRFIAAQAVLLVLLIANKVWKKVSPA